MRISDWSSDVCSSDLAAGVQVVLVRVGHDTAKVPHPKPITDSSFSGFQYGPDAKEILPELGPEAGDIVVDKYNWRSFYGPYMDNHLRHRQITTLFAHGLVPTIRGDTTIRHAPRRDYQPRSV